jgi:hypothetical protein
MDAREELLRVTLGKIVTGVLILIGFLIVVVWREALFGKWEQIAEGLSKQALLALLGLALIAAAIELLCVAYLLYLVYRSSRAIPTVLPPHKPLRRFGVHWDEDFHPVCPVCDVLLPIHHDDGEFEVLWCPKCKMRFMLRDDYGQRVSLVDAKLELAD